jgi:DNA modification methylase
LWGRIIIGDSRSMKEIRPQAVDLVVTSPPYWHIKDYGVPGQIGYGQTLHGYLRDLYRVWQECHRVLRAGARLCINIGDQFARSTIYGRYKVIPIHAEVIAQCERIGFDFMGSIIWQKKTTVNTTGGANVMGSYPYPPNGIVELDYEFIHIFKKPGKPKEVLKETKQASRLSKEEWKACFTGHWRFGGARQIEHEAMFPDELPRRLIRMFSFIGDAVLDPFLGSGTTAKMALEQGRNAVGYEINEGFLDTIKGKVGLDGQAVQDLDWLDIVSRSAKPRPARKLAYTPAIQDAKPEPQGKARKPAVTGGHRVIEITREGAIRLDTGPEIRFLGVRVKKKAAMLRYLRQYLLGKTVLLRFDGGDAGDQGTLGRRRAEPARAYVYLRNRIFVNTYLIKSGLASPDPSERHRLRPKFLEMARQARAR